MLIEFERKMPRVNPTAYIAPGAILVGDVTVLAGASVWFNAVIRADFNSVIIGEGSNVQDNAVVHCEIGNLWIRGESAAAGYWNRRERTRATFVGEWVMTGDKYIRDEKGYFCFSGRSDDMLKVSGLWVSPVEIESALLAHPAVAECAVVGCNDTDGLTNPKAFVVAASSTSPGELLGNELQEFLKGKIASYKIPRWIVFAESLPKTATGKIQRFKLRGV